MEKHMVIDENSFAYEAIDELCKLYKSYQDIMESRIFDDDGLVDERGECGQIGEAIVKSIYHIAAQYHQNEIDDENDDEKAALMTICTADKAAEELREIAIAACNGKESAQ